MQAYIEYGGSVNDVRVEFTTPKLGEPSAEELIWGSMEASQLLGRSLQGPGSGGLNPFRPWISHLRDRSRLPGRWRAINPASRDTRTIPGAFWEHP